MTRACRECPFLTLVGFAEQSRKIDAGHWIPCVKTVTAPTGRTCYERVAAWAAEEECTAARTWRQYREPPLGIEPGQSEDEAASARLAAALSQAAGASRENGA